MNSWFSAPPLHLLWILLSCTVFYLLIILITRVVGLRSFTTFSSFDILITLAMGALLATTVLDREVALLEGLTALVSLFGLQILVSTLRARSSLIKKWLDTPPTLLMKDGRILHDNLRAVRLTEDELLAKLRANNVFNYGQVVAVVLESSGEVSVLKKSKGDIPLNDQLLEGVVSEA
ncbi:DUF421 domain-containing protein [Persicitalea sp.]|uniref:DUF421 domain-containing protein n=1 Tax=Persicitalea sp. TaxID=3100273 RepID=UPI0035934384